MTTETVPSFRGFVEFLEADPDHVVNFMDPANCALGRYGQQVTQNPEIMGGVYGYEGPEQYVTVLPSDSLATSWMWAGTYGEAAERLRPLLAQTEAV